MAKKKVSRTQEVQAALAPLLGRQVSLRGIRLVGFAARHKLPESADGEIEMPEEVQQKVNLRVPDQVEGGDIAYGVRLELVGKGKQEETLLQISATYGVAYHVTPLDGITTEELHRFGQISAMFHVWPFWREFVHSTMSRFDLPTFTVPLLYPGGMNFEIDGDQDESPPKPPKKTGRRSKS